MTNLQSYAGNVTGSSPYTTHQNIIQSLQVRGLSMIRFYCQHGAKPAYSMAAVYPFLFVRGAS